MSAPSEPAPKLVPVERFPHTVAWGPVAFLAAAALAALLPLVLAIVLAA